jgi:hypothetical protein
MPALSQVFENEIRVIQECLGLRVEEEVYHPSDFGNALIVLKGDKLSVRLVRERGQLFVDLASSSGDWIYADDFLEQHQLHPAPGTSLSVPEAVAVLCAHAEEVKRQLARLSQI